MKKLIALLAVCAILAPATALGWGRQGHATIAKVAERHLTPKAKKSLDKILHGRSIVYYASHADDYKSQLPVDLGFDPTDWDRVTTYPHTFEATEDCTPWRTLERDGKYVKNCLYYIDRMSKTLREEPHNLTDSARVMHVALIVHFVGDMHCPMHIRYPESQDIGYFKVTMGGKEYRYHTLWDTPIVTSRNPWSFSDIAELVDTYTKKEIKAVTAGDVYDWGKDSAEASRFLHKTKAGDELGKMYTIEHRELVETQLAKGGYRLAKVLNDIFK